MGMATLVENLLRDPAEEPAASQRRVPRHALAGRVEQASSLMLVAAGFVPRTWEIPPG